VRKLFIAMAFVAAWVSTGVAARDLNLRPGEQVVVEIDADGAMTVAAGDVTRISREEQAGIVDAVARNPGAQGPNSVGVNGAEFGVKPVESDKLRISFIDLASIGMPDDRLLVIENGYGRALRYRAVISRGTRSQPTDVCTVLPTLRGYEHWPYPIDAIELSDLALVPYQEGTAPVCE
jgi:hypothetical protein